MWEFSRYWLSRTHHFTWKYWSLSIFCSTYRLTVNRGNYRTLHSYNFIWFVCHLFPQQRWRMHTYSVSGNHWPGEPHDMRKTTSARTFSSCVWSHQQDAYFQTSSSHPFAHLPNFFAAATHSLQCDSTGVYVVPVEIAFCITKLGK